MLSKSMRMKRYLRKKMWLMQRKRQTNLGAEVTGGSKSQMSLSV